MFYDVVILDPNTYIKKSKKINDFSESDEFIGVLQKKFSDWNVSYSSINKVAVAHKLKYDQFDANFFRQSHVIVYIVSLFSEVGFRDSVKKLIGTCHDKGKLDRVIVISLDKSHFVELDDSVIELVHFGECSWASEDDKQWNMLEELLLEKLHAEQTRTVMAPIRPNAATLPIAVPHQKSSFKIKSFFNSLPARFDNLEKKITFREKTPKDGGNDSVPSITISKTHKDDFNTNYNHKNVGLRSKEDHSKLSLTSLFRKRSRKARDSGISGTSTASNGSGSRHSRGNFNDLVFDLSGESSPGCQRSGELMSSSLHKTKTYKAKIYMFKDKASKYFSSASCLNSPENKRRKNSIDSLSEDAKFSSHQMVALAGILCQDSKQVQCHRMRSESPNMVLHSPHNGLLKYYSWNANLDTRHEYVLDKVACDESKIMATVHSSINQSLPCNIEQDDPEDILEDPILEVTSDTVEEPHTLLLMDFMEDDVSQSVTYGNLESKAQKEVTTSEEIDGNYFQVQYAPNLDISPRKASKHSVTFKLDGLDSLENIMESIEKSCNELKIHSRSSRSTDTTLHTFKSPTTEKSHHNGEVDEIVEESKLSGQQTEPNRKELQRLSKANETTVKDTESDSRIVQSHSLLHRATQTLSRNPFMVMGFFTITALSAPLWSTYIPHHAAIGDTITGTFARVFDRLAVPSLGHQFVPTVMRTTSSAAQSLYRYLIPSHL